MEVYANFTGFLWETAKEFNALVVFAEVAALLPPSCCAFCSVQCCSHSTTPLQAIYRHDADAFVCSIATMARASLLVRYGSHDWCMHLLLKSFAS